MSFFELVPTTGFMDMRQGMVFGQHARLELSRKTPVIDNLPGFEKLYEKLVDDITTHNVVDIFAIGKSGIGKGAIIEQTLRKLDEDKRLKRTRRRQGVTKQYYSLAAQFQDAVRELGVVSPWGEFTPEELAIGAEQAAVLGKQKLQAAEKQAPKPLVRGLDFVTVAAPIDLGLSLVKDAIQRGKEDPSYTYRIVAVTTDPQVQNRTLSTREALWELPDAVESQEVTQVLRRSKVVPDSQDLALQSIRTSAGHPRGLQMVNQLIHEQIIQRQDEMREKVVTGFPQLQSPEDITRTPESLSVAEDGYYRLLLFHDLKADPTRTLIVPNTFLDRQIPFYMRRTSRYRIH